MDNKVFVTLVFVFGAGNALGNLLSWSAKFAERRGNGTPESRTMLDFAGLSVRTVASVAAAVFGFFYFGFVDSAFSTPS